MTATAKTANRRSARPRWRCWRIPTPPRLPAISTRIALPAHEDLREPENGLVMVRGRIGGDGAPFNLGEATVSRAAVRLATGEVGFGYTLGRDRQKARMIALCDALIQSTELCRRGGGKGAGAAARGHDRRAQPQGGGDRGDAGRFLHAGAR